MAAYHALRAWHNNGKEAQPMRIAIPVVGDDVSEGLTSCAAVKLYEDDHGTVTKRVVVPVGAGETALSVIVRHGVDVLLCGALSPEERRSLAAEGLLLAEASARNADDAVRAYLGAAVFCDPGNHCNYCGFKDACGLPRT